ncbi:hypothetical protein B0H21DRAFT_735446 [Amylocystis lapponica]|nr:hypothetical protein B0H21DRAFT_735446 [Amylocystis lapponica]
MLSHPVRISQGHPMNLYLVPNDPERTTLVSANGIAYYQVATTVSRPFGGPSVSRIKRPAESEGDSIVAEVEWRRWGAHPIVRSNVFDGSDQELEVRELLYKRGKTFSSTRYFIGNDDEVYRWKLVKGIGFVLTNHSTGDEVARFTQDLVRDVVSQIRPSALNTDMIVITFIIMEKRRRDRVTDHTAVAVPGHDEDPGDGGGDDGGGEA